MDKGRRKAIAIVTGASSGMGREAALQLADRFGWLDEIWAVARREERLARLAEESTVRVRPFAADLSGGFAAGSEAGYTALAPLCAALERERPAVRFLVNAAGGGRSGRSDRLSAEEEAAMIRVNCEALCAVTHLALAYLAPRARILQFASAAAFLPQPEFAVYAATKAFVLSYSRALGRELAGRGITVTAVCPGPVRTEFLDTMTAGGADYPFYKRLVMAKPEAVVEAAIRDSVLKKSVSVYGPAMRAFQAAAKLLPQDLILRLAGK